MQKYSYLLNFVFKLCQLQSIKLALNMCDNKTVWMRCKMKKFFFHNKILKNAACIYIQPLCVNSFQLI